MITDRTNSLMKEASTNAKKAGERGVSAKNVKKVTEVRLKMVIAGYKSQR